MKIDFRSDTVTKPTPGMISAMSEAVVGDDVFREDVSVNFLENTMAALFGMESALWCPSGTMSNQIAISTHTQPGDEVICDQDAHVFYYEGGGIALNAGCQARTIKGDYGRISADQVSAVINPDDVHRARTSLVCLENTVNRGGGCCYALEEIKKIRAICDEAGLALHLDGARLFNALTAKKEQPRQYGELFDSISVCFNKGLGCPAGSVLMGKETFIRAARRKRKVFGGGLRQAGYLAATASYALDHHVKRLHIDHDHAKIISRALENHKKIKTVLPVETNLVVFEFENSAECKRFQAFMKDHEILMLTTAPDRLRIVTHLDINEDMISRFLTVLSNYR